MADRNPKDLSPAMYPKFIAWDQGMDAAGIDYILTCTRRSQAEQDALFAQGRTTPGEICTWTTHSHHLTGDAFDFVVIVNGKPDWKMVYKDPWNRAVAIGKSLGLTQVTNSKGQVKEFAHLQEA